MIKEHEVKTYEQHFLCDKCNEEVTYTGMVGLTYPAKFEHKCKCGEVYYLGKRYPAIDYK